MNEARDWILLAMALLLAAVSSILPLQLGFGAVGAWGLGTLISTLLFCFAGGSRRVSLMAVAVIPPFLVNRATELHYAWSERHSTQSPSEALASMFPEALWTSLLAFGLFVALPLVLSLIASRVLDRTPNAS